MISPALQSLLLFLNQQPSLPEHLFLFVSFFYGVLSTIPAIGLETAFGLFNLDGFEGTVIFAFLGVALVEEFVKGCGYQYTLIGSWGRMVASSPFYNNSYEMQIDMTILKKCIGNAVVIDKSSAVRFFRPVRIK